jgi:hypothetical protein
MKNEINKYMRLFKNLFWDCFKQSKYNLVSWVLLIIVLLFIWMLGFHVGLEWENEKIVKSTNSLWFGGGVEDYKLGFSFAYFFLLVASIFFASKNNHQIYHLNTATFWLTLPIKREYLFLNQLLSQTLILFSFFFFLQSSVWFILGIKYGVWLLEFFKPMFIMFFACLLVVLITNFFALITENKIISLFLSLLFIVIYPFIILFLEKSINLELGEIYIFGYVIKLLDLKLIDFLLNGANFITGKYLIDISDFLHLIVVFIIFFICNLLIFKRKYY